MPRFGKAPLMALRERLAKAFEAAPSKQELVVTPNEVPPELYESLKRGDGRAVETVSRALGKSSPKGAEGLRQLIEEVSPSRRGFLKGLGGSAANLIMPSPLKFLQATEDALRPRLTAELTPMELMEYSKKYFDKPVDLSTNMDTRMSMGGYEGLGRSIRDVIGHLDLAEPQDWEATLKALDLKPTEQNLKSLEDLHEAVLPLSPDTVQFMDASRESLAQDMARGDYQDTDSFLDETARRWGIPPIAETTEPAPGRPMPWRKETREYEEFVGKLENFLDDLYQTPKEWRGNMVQGRYNLDMNVEDHAHAAGFFDEEADYDPGPMPKKKLSTAAEFMERWPDMSEAQAKHFEALMKNKVFTFKDVVESWADDSGKAVDKKTGKKEFGQSALDKRRDVDEAIADEMRSQEFEDDMWFNGEEEG